MSGAPAPRSPGVRLALRGAVIQHLDPGGVEVLVAVAGLPGGTAVIRSFVPDAVLRHGVTRAWLLLLGVGALACWCSAWPWPTSWPGRLVRPLTALARAADRLAGGDLSARATVAGPPEVRRVGTGLNRLAARIGELLAHERETVADLSHRLRTPLTALRIDAESLRDDAERAQLLSDVDRDGAHGQRDHPRGPAAGAATAPGGVRRGRVVAERAAFWRPLAEDQDRAMTVELAAGRCRSGCPARTSPHARTSCWRTCSRTPRKARPSAPAQPPGRAAGRGWWSPTTGRGSPPAPSGAACPAAGRPGLAWTSPGGSPKRPAGP